MLSTYLEDELLLDELDELEEDEEDDELEEDELPLINVIFQRVLVLDEVELGNSQHKILLIRHVSLA